MHLLARDKSPNIDDWVSKVPPEVWSRIFAFGAGLLLVATILLARSRNSENRKSAVGAFLGFLICAGLVVFNASHGTWPWPW
jgi:hypothetical protein